MELIGAVVLGIFVSLIAFDISQNINSICNWLTQRAASLTPMSLRARLHEEWSADVDDTSSVTLKLFVILGFFVAALRIQLGVFRVRARSVFNQQEALDHQNDETIIVPHTNDDEKAPVPFAFNNVYSSAIKTIHCRLTDHFDQQGPWHHLDPVSQLVLGILGGRTRGSVSLSALEALINRFESWEAVRDASYCEVRETIASVTFPDNKARYIQAALHQLTAARGRLELEFLALWPVDSALAWLEKLPGAGRRVSAATLNFSSLKMRALVVDSHHLRVTKRLGLLRRQAGFGEAYCQLTSRMPVNWTSDDVDEHHQLVKLLGQTVCRHDTPVCAECPLRDLCPTSSVSIS